MTTEEKLKEYILTRYRSVREFVIHANIPYTTMDGILKRGIANSTIGNIIAICRTLGISADALGKGEIVPIQNAANNTVSLCTITQYMQLRIEHECITLDDQPLSPEEKTYANICLDLMVEYIRKKRGTNA